ncbi:hypothetical protein [Streptomyces acidicola]|uniref:hypothetical protein n=1 Tax=Streptomyces acidicola TaxID=2596892 RepID=UPI0038144323
MCMFWDGLDAAVQKSFTRPAPKSAGAQMRYLVKHLKGTRPVADLLGITQRTVERYVKDQIKKPRPELAARHFNAQDQGATDQRLREIVAEAIKDVYFQDNGRRSGQLEDVRFTDIEHLAFDL